MISEDVLIRVSHYTDEEVTEALNDWDCRKPKEVVKEELGGDFYYRCPWLSCNEIVKRGWVACPHCGTKLKFPY